MQSVAFSTLQQELDFPLDEQNVGLASVFDINPAITVDEEADRQSENPSVTFRQVGVSDGHGVIHFQLLIEDTHGAGLIVEGNADDLQTLLTVSVLQIHETWNFPSAGRTPSCPEVEQNYLAPVGWRDRASDHLDR
jgi:hypothetical protein